MIELRGRSSIGEMEELLERIVSSPSDADMLVSNSLKGRTFAATAAYMQLLVTWARSCPEGRLRVHVREDADGDRARTTLGRALKSDHLMLAASLAGDVRARRGERELGGIAAPILEDRFLAMNSVGALLEKGDKAFAMCLDDSPIPFPKVLYRDPPTRPQRGRGAELLGLGGFQNLAGGIQDKFNEGIGGGASFAGSGSLSTAIFELFKNTDEWARSDQHDLPYPRSSSVRGIRVERRNVDAEMEEAEDQPALRDFFAHESLRSPDGRRRLVELTVFDSGPGVPSRRLLARHPEGAKADVGEEFLALRDCLRKHVTTSKKDPRGTGLHRVLQDLTDLNAFLWLRSGRLSLYRDFLAMPYRPEDGSRDEPFLLDWRAGLGGITELAPAAGSFFTALLPIAHDPRQTSF
ncbi:MAG TPA: hypothetical protein VIT89_07615 [Solirubrobacterales bacterium]